VNRNSIKRGPRQGTVVVWPSGVQDRYGISAPTRWRWEKMGRLPKRDVNVGGKTGWRPATLEAADRGPVSKEQAKNVVLGTGASRFQAGAKGI
jgi:predicted DNA-binding transcriptional regulator AlpA